MADVLIGGLGDDGHHGVGGRARAGWVEQLPLHLDRAGWGVVGQVYSHRNTSDACGAMLVAGQLSQYMPPFLYAAMR